MWVNSGELSSVRVVGFGDDMSRGTRECGGDGVSFALCAEPGRFLVFAVVADRAVRGERAK